MTDEWNVPTYAMVTLATAVYLEQRCHELAGMNKEGWCKRGNVMCSVTAVLGLVGLMVLCVAHVMTSTDAWVRAVLVGTALAASVVAMDSLVRLTDKRSHPFPCN